MTLVYANKAFGFSPEYTLWGISWQSLNCMFSELHYYNLEQQKELKGNTDDKGDFEWVEIPTIDGVKKVKKYNNPRIGD